MPIPVRKRYLLYAQHLTGAGHFVRAFEVARELARQHDVYLVDGGQIIRDAGQAGFSYLEIPRIRRTGGELRPIEAGICIKDVMRRRLELLLAAVSRLAPDVIFIEHFPFSKFELANEIFPIIEAARARNRHAKVICSVRDVLSRTRHELSSKLDHRRVLDTLRLHFDCVLVHSDPDFISIDDHVPWAEEISPPVHHTGYVSQKLVPKSESRSKRDRAFVVVSGGGCVDRDLVVTAVEAWKRLVSEPTFNGKKMIVFLGPAATRQQEQELAEVVAGSSIEIQPFSEDFIYSMQSAELSVSHAGYNTCTNLLETRTRAVLIPSRQVSDQRPRAARFAERGLAQVIVPADLTAERLASAMQRAMAIDVPVHQINLNGAEMTRILLDRLQ